MIDIVINNRFFILKNKYYFNNIEYLNFERIVIFYCNIWYHLKKQNLIRQKSKNAKKFWNLYYISLQNMV